MKTGTLATKLMLAAILLTVLIYFGINLVAYFMDPFTTTVAYSYTSENAVTVSGYVVRDEEALSGGGDLVYFSRSEGEKVSAGGTVALVYQTAQALSDANTIRTLEEQLEQLSYARSLASSLRAAVLKRSYAYTGTEELDAAIASLQAQISTLSASSDPNTSRVTATRSGLFSSLVDGYETVLTPEKLKDMTPAQYRAITPESAGGVGKIIYGSSWSFVTLRRVSDMGKLKVGDTITLRFQTGLDRDLTMTVERISDEDSGQRLVVFTSQRYLNLTTLLRRQNAQVIFNSYTGIRVPRSAVRILWEPVTDEEGEPVLKEDGTQQSEQVSGL